ncbi:hypothetical protein [Marinobacterium lacunae]|nr:hypothetical protein [Marinobacterium lacunae]
MSQLASSPQPPPLGGQYIAATTSVIPEATHYAQFTDLYSEERT